MGNTIGLGRIKASKFGKLSTLAPTPPALGIMSTSTFAVEAR
jgi:hypothetical protein